jgi:peroxiredoxin
VDESGSAEPPSRRPPATMHAYFVLARRFIILGAVLLVVVLVVAELRRSGTNDVGGTTTANYRAVARVDGRPAPGFEMPGLDGRTVSLADYRGHVVVLNFWATWCAPCRLEAAALEAAFEDYRGKGVQFLGVNYRDDAAAARAYEGEFGITYPSAYDPGGTLAFDYELIGLPTTFIIGRDGLIHYRFVGYLTGAVLRRALDDVLTGNVG